MGPVITIVYIALVVVICAGGWKMFVKAGKPGWGFLVPIYNIVLYCEIAERPTWWVLLCFVPIANLVVIILLFIEIAKKFGKGTGFAFGMIFLGFIFIPILGFGDAQYLDAETSTAGAAPPPPPPPV